MNPEDDFLKQRYWEERIKQKKREEFPVDQFKAMGYSDEEIEAMKERL